MREVIVTNQLLWSEAFGEMKQYSASTMCFVLGFFFKLLLFMFVMCCIKCVKEFITAGLFI